MGSATEEVKQGDGLGQEMQEEEGSSQVRCLKTCWWEQSSAVSSQLRNEPPWQKQMACGIRSFWCSRNGEVSSMTGTVGEVRGTPQKVREGQAGCEEVPYLISLRGPGEKMGGFYSGGREAFGEFSAGCGRRNPPTEVSVLIPGTQD